MDEGEIMHNVMFLHSTEGKSHHFNIKYGIADSDLWFFVKSRDVPLHHLLHAVEGVFLDCSPEKEICCIISA